MYCITGFITMQWESLNTECVYISWAWWVCWDCGFNYVFLSSKLFELHLQSQQSHSVLKLNDNITCSFAYMPTCTLYTKLVQLMNRIKSTPFMPNHSHNMVAFLSSFCWNLGWNHCKYNHWQQLAGSKESGCNTSGTSILWVTNKNPIGIYYHLSRAADRNDNCSGNSNNQQQ